MGACLCRSSTPSQSRKHSEELSSEQEELQQASGTLAIDEKPPVVETISNLNETVDNAFRRFAGNKEELSDENGGKISEFFAELGFSLDKAEGFTAFCVMNIDEFSRIKLQEVKKYCTSHSVTLWHELKKTLATDTQNLYASARGLRSLFQYIFTTSKKQDSQFKSLSRDIAVPILKLLIQTNVSFKKNPIAQEFYIYIEGSSKAAFTKDEWCYMGDFLYTFKDSLNNYQFEDSWPTLFDEFVQGREIRDRV